ncbi:MAG: ABC transporter ATP-binding protein [Oscillospiraceae bacterium]|nr:ABC transporter ATP-binding protein [Oscillospiraceae bacterium]
MLKIKNIYAGYNGIDVLHGISFEALNGQDIGIIGPNGCGKSTLLKVIANLMPFRGDVFIDGVSVKNMKRKDLAMKIGLLSQITQVYFSYSIYETVMMGRFAYGNNKLFSRVSREDEKAVEDSLNAVHLFNLKDKEINELSGGQLQRVFLAKVLAQDPEVILLDEPTNHLDLSYQVELIRYLKNWAKTSSKSVIAVLHDINHALFFSDEILVLSDGIVKAYGNVRDVISTSLLKEVYEMDVVSYMKDSLKKWEDIL